jgi:uncharacterized damage-inducible protein DinB
MALIDKTRDLWQHAVWADVAVFAAIEAGGAAASSAVREFAHLVAAQEVWLARLEGRPVQVAVWPDLSVAEVKVRFTAAEAAFATYMETLRPADLETVVDYTTGDGRPFSNSVGDILLHLPLHAQYHRGRINQLLRQAGCEPAAVDYIAFVRRRGRP